MRTLYLVTGLSGSGKTTFCNLFAKHLDIKIISSDEIRYAAFGPQWSKNDTDAVYNILINNVINALSNDKNVIIDSPMLSKSDRKFFVDNFRPYFKRCVSIYIDTPLPICLIRNFKRETLFNKKVSAKFIINAKKRLQIPTEDEGFDEIIKLSNFKKDPASIYYFE